MRFLYKYLPSALLVCFFTFTSCSQQVKNNQKLDPNVVVWKGLDEMQLKGPVKSMKVYLLDSLSDTSKIDLSENLVREHYFDSNGFTVKVIRNYSKKDRELNLNYTIKDGRVIHQNSLQHPDMKIEYQYNLKDQLQSQKMIFKNGYENKKQRPLNISYSYTDKGEIAKIVEYFGITDVQDSVITIYKNGIVDEVISENRRIKIVPSYDSISQNIFRVKSLTYSKKIPDRLLETNYTENHHFDSYGNACLVTNSNYNYFSEYTVAPDIYTNSTIVLKKIEYYND